MKGKRWPAVVCLDRPLLVRHMDSPVAAVFAVAVGAVLVFWISCLAMDNPAAK